MECRQQSYQECLISKIKRSLKARKNSYDSRATKNKCHGTEELNKIAFLSMIGVKRYSTPKTIVVAREEERFEVLDKALKENNGDFQKAARSLEITSSVFKRRYNMLYSRVNSNAINEETASPTPERRFFENLSNPWSIKSFDPETREVCIDVNAGATITHISSTIRNY